MCFVGSIDGRLGMVYVFMPSKGEVAVIKGHKDQRLDKGVINLCTYNKLVECSHSYIELENRVLF